MPDVVPRAVQIISFNMQILYQTHFVEKESRVREWGLLGGGEDTGCGITFSGQGNFTEQKRQGLNLKKVRVRAEQSSGERTLQAEEAARTRPEVQRAWHKSG